MFLKFFSFKAKNPKLVLVLEEQEILVEHLTTT